MKKALFITVLFVSTLQLAAKTAVGDEVIEGNTFDFSIGAAVFNSASSTLWTASGQDISAKSDAVQDFGIATIPMISVNGVSDPSFTATAKVTEKAVQTTGIGESLILESLVSNPLRGKRFSGLTLVGTNPSLIDQDEQRYLYYMQEVNFTASQDDSNSSIIHRYDLGEAESAKFISGIGSNLFVVHTDGTFGTDVSTIAFLSKQSVVIKSGTTSKNYEYLKAEASSVIDLTTPVLLAGGGSIVAMGDSVAMYPYGTKMYMGVDITADSGTANHGVGLFVATGVAQTDNTTASLTFSSILPDDVAGDSDTSPIFATSNAGRIAVRNVTTTVTSTGLSYLIASRDDGVGGLQSVYAAPLVTHSATADDNGKIGKFGSLTKDFKISGIRYREHGFDTVIDDAAEIDVAGDAGVVTRIQVGGGPVPIGAGEGYINQLFAQGDSVYIATGGVASAGTQTGLFQSQALFDASGQIVSWTPWQRITGEDDGVLFAMKNPLTGSVMFIESPANQEVHQTTWNNDHPTAQEVNNRFKKDTGGIQGLFAFSKETPGFSNPGVTEVSLIVSTGNPDIVLNQTGSYQVDSFRPLTSLTPLYLNTNASDIDLGSIVAAEFGQNSGEADHWLFVGGEKGLAVLANTDDGTSWGEYLTDVAGAVPPRGLFHTIGSFSFVKKIVADGDYVYVLTSDALHRFEPAAAKFPDPKDYAFAALDEVSVLQGTALHEHAHLLDVIVDDDFVIVGTTHGMYSIDVSGGLPATPVKIDIPGTFSSVSKLVTASGDANYSRKFKDLSNLYALVGDHRTEQSSICRFYIADGVVAPIEDQLIEDENGPLLVFDYFINNIFIDGSLGFATSYKMGSTIPVMKHLQSSLQAGRSGRHVGLAMHTTDTLLSWLEDSVAIHFIIRDFGTGALMMAGDFGALLDF